MNKDFSNNATPKYLGYVYQVLIAIEMSFEVNKNQTIWLECFGDIYDGHRIIEVKNHLEEHNLVSSSVDFWKTLKNFLTEDTETVEKFILHTTSVIKSDSIFYNWNNEDKEAKYQKLKSHIPAGSINEYYKIIFEDNRQKKLLSILDKLVIKYSQSSIQDKWTELKEHRYINHFGNYIEDVLHWAYGYFNKQAIIEYRKWNIKINDLDDNLRLLSNKFKRDKIPFPVTSKDSVSITEQKFQFINDLEKINLKKATIEKAVSDYLRAHNSAVKLITKFPDFIPDILAKHDDNILDILTDKKLEHIEFLSESDIQTDKIFQTSQRLYHDCINSSTLIDIPEISNTNKYYQNGRIHHNVNEKKFSWVFKEEDLT